MKWMEESGIKEVDVKTEGITTDHIWWHGDILTRKMSGWVADFQRLVQTMEDRHKEHLKMIAELLEERKQLMARGTKESEAIVIYNELQEAESFLFNLTKVTEGKFLFETLPPDEVEGQISLAIKRLNQLCDRLEKE